MKAFLIGAGAFLVCGLFFVGFVRIEEQANRIARLEDQSRRCPCGLQADPFDPRLPRRIVPAIPRRNGDLGALGDLKPSDN